MQFFILMCVCGIAAARSLTDLTDSLTKAVPKCGVEVSQNPIHRNPWMVFLEYYRRGVRFDTRCGGTLISRRHVVTAAHCVKRGLTKSLKMIARLGEYNLESEVDCESGACAHLPVKITVERIDVHPGYDGKEHDIAIITLAHDAPYTETIRPACLPSSQLEEDAIFNAAGWGEESTKGVYSNVKKSLNLPYWTPERCQNTYRNIALPKQIICAGGERGIDTCRGDSGGPLILRGERAELWGVTSTGNAICGTKGYPGIYTSVLDHLEWIMNTIELK